MKHALVLLLTIVFAAPSVAAEKTLKGIVAGHVPKGTVWYDQWLARKEAIAGDAAGMEFDFFIHGELGNDEAVLAGLRRGRVSIFGPSLTGLAGLIPETAVISLPYLFETKAEADAFFRCCGRTVFEPFFQEKGFIFLGWAEAGWKGVYANKPVRLPRDASGLRLRVPAAAAGQIFAEQIGAEAIFLGLNDIVPSLETGLIDGGMAAVPFYWGTVRDIAKHYVVTSHAYEVAPFLANARWWRGASDAQRTLLRNTFARYGEDSIQVRAFDDTLLNELREGDEVEIIDLTPGERAEWIAVGRASHAAALERIGGRAQAVYDDIQGILAEIRRGDQDL